MPHELSIAFQTDKRAAAYIELAQRVDQYDFDVVSVYCDAPFQPSYGPLLLMAPHLRRARLGPAAVQPARIHPIDIASQTALLADLAAGGVYVGLVRGAWLEDHGIVEPARPMRALRETVDIVRYLLRGETGGYAGEVYRLAPHVSATYPLPPGEIPVMIGTWGRKLAALAGEIADEVKVGGSANPDFVPVIASYIAAGERAANRTESSVGVVLGAVTVVDEDREQAREEARRQVALYLPVVAPLDPTVTVEADLIARLRVLADEKRFAEAARLVSDDLLERFAFAGSPDDIIRQCDAIFSSGARRIEFGTPHGLPSANGIRLLGEVVVPALRSNWR